MSQHCICLGKFSKKDTNIRKNFRAATISAMGGNVKQKYLYCKTDRPKRQTLSVLTSGIPQCAICYLNHWFVIFWFLHLYFSIHTAFSLNCYTCLNQPIHECLKNNQTCGNGMNKCFSMQKDTDIGGVRYTKFCAEEWYCERYDAACEDLDEPEYSYMECDVGCCTSDLCNRGDSIVSGRSVMLLVFTCLVTLVPLFQLW